MVHPKKHFIKERVNHEFVITSDTEMILDLDQCPGGGGNNPEYTPHLGISVLHMEIPYLYFEAYIILMTFLLVTRVIRSILPCTGTIKLVARQAANVKVMPQMLCSLHSIYIM